MQHSSLCDVVHRRAQVAASFSLTAPLCAFSAKTALRGARSPTDALSAKRTKSSRSFFPAFVVIIIDILTYMQTPYKRPCR